MGLTLKDGRPLNGALTIPIVVDVPKGIMTIWPGRKFRSEE